jgi:hypothetical protein
VPGCGIEIHHRNTGRADEKLNVMLVVVRVSNVLVVAELRGIMNANGLLDLFLICR